MLDELIFISLLLPMKKKNTEMYYHLADLNKFLSILHLRNRIARPNKYFRSRLA